MQIVEMSIADIKPYARNPRKNEAAVEVVANSIKEFGFKVPIIIDGDGEIVAGHTRLKAAVSLGLESVPVIVADDLTPEQIKAFRLADNKTAELAEWDFDLLDEELFGIIDIDMSYFGFALDDEPQELAEDDFDVELPEEPISRLGDIWVLGNHRLMCGDSTKADAVFELTGGGIADMLLTDPPYNVSYSGKTKARMTIENDNMSEADFVQFLGAAFSAAGSCMRPGAAYYIWHSDGKRKEFLLGCEIAGWTIREILIWSKNQMVLSRQDYHWQHEPCLYGWTDGAAHTWNSDRKQTTIMEFAKPVRSDEHPTMKPVALMGYLIGNSSKKGDTVLDVFGGSGSTLIACEQLDRKCCMMEIDPKYVDVVVDRFIDYSGSSNDVHLIRDGKQLQYEDVICC